MHMHNVCTVELELNEDQLVRRQDKDAPRICGSDPYKTKARFCGDGFAVNFVDFVQSLITSQLSCLSTVLIYVKHLRVRSKLLAVTKLSYI